MRGFISIKLASFSTSILYKDFINLLATSFWLFEKLNIEITFSICKLLGPSSFKSILVVIIFSGFSIAIFSISIPPSVLLMNAIFELSRSTKHDK